MRIEVPDDCEDWVGWITERLIASGDDQDSRDTPGRLAGVGMQCCAGAFQNVLPCSEDGDREQSIAVGIGRLVGQRLAYLHRMAALSASETEALRRSGVRAETKNGKHAAAFIERTFRDAAASVCLAMLDSDTRGSEFLMGFASRPADLKASNFLRTNTLLYWALLRGWRSVSKFDTLEDFHAALCRHLGRNTVGKLPRLAKLCQRIKLQFRGRGRPPKKRK